MSSISDLSNREKLNLAFDTSDERVLDELKLTPDINVRRAVAKNRNVNVRTLNYLAMDPVLNVSFVAIQNPKCTVTRKFHETKLSKCVTCEVDERSLNCLACSFREQ